VVLHGRVIVVDTAHVDVDVADPRTAWLGAGLRWGHSTLGCKVLAGPVF
jgi:hypothetical protein